MLPPALLDLLEDDELTIKRLRLYRWLLEELAFHEPQRVKLAAAAHVARANRRTVSKHLSWLVEGGYLVEHLRDTDGVRCFALRWERDFGADGASAGHDLMP